MSVAFDTLFAPAATLLDDLFGGKVSFVFAAHDGTLDAYGQPTYSAGGDWDTVATVSGFLYAASSAEATLGGPQKATDLDFLITLDYSAAVARGQRITHPDGKVSYVKGIRDPDGQQRILSIESSLIL